MGQGLSPCTPFGAHPYAYPPSRTDGLWNAERVTDAPAVVRGSAWQENLAEGLRRTPDMVAEVAGNAKPLVPAMHSQALKGAGGRSTLAHRRHQTCSSEAVGGAGL